MKNTSGKKQLSVMMILTVITQFIAIYKSTLTAANFGAGTELDAYNFANNLATFFLTFISTGITTVVIPAYIKKTDRKAIDTFITIIFSFVISLLFVMYIFRNTIVRILTDRDEIFYSYFSEFFLIIIFIQLIPAFLAVTTAYFQCINKFNIPKVVLLISNIVVVLALMQMKQFTISSYLWILLFGVLIQFLIDMFLALRNGFRFRPTLNIHNKEFVNIFNVFLPTVFSSGLYKVQSLIDSLLTSNIGVGQLTILTYSNTIVGMVNNMLINNLCVYAYPKIVAKTNSKKESQSVLWNYIIAFHCVLCLLIAGFVAAGREFISILYEHGKFTSDAANSVFICMCIYIWGQQNNIIRDLLYRYFYAHQDTKSTFKNSFLASLVNIIFSIILVKYIGVYGIVLGTVIAGLYSLISVLIKFKNKFGINVSKRNIVIELGKNEVSLLISVFISLFVKNIFGVKLNFIGLFVGGISSAVSFVICLFILRSKVFKIRI